MSLNLDTLISVLREADIGCIEEKAKAVAPRLPLSEVQYAKSFRLDPFRYFSKLVDDPKTLVDAMSMCGAILGGSRAADYFYPGAASEESDWDFYCNNARSNTVMFGLCLEELGVEWETQGRDGNADNGYNGFRVMTGTIASEKQNTTVQLIYSNDLKESTISMVLGFHSSIAQCFISGFAAISLYGRLTLRGLSLPWAQYCHDGTEGAKNIRARKKYEARGIRYISYEQYSDEAVHCTSDTAEALDLTVMEPRARYVGDSGCHVVSFEQYFDDTPQKRSVRYRIERLSRNTWRETPYACFSRCSKNFPIASEPHLLVSAKDPDSTVHKLASVLSGKVRALGNNEAVTRLRMEERCLEVTSYVPWCPLKTVGELAAELLGCKLHLAPSGYAEDFVSAAHA